MGRANVYLPDDLERRVKAALVPISEVCQRALLAAVEAAEGTSRPFSDAVGAQFRLGRVAGLRWATEATEAQLLTLLRDQQLPEIPAGLLPHDLYALTREQSLGWEAGFVEGARAAVRDLLPAISLPTPDAPATAATDQEAAADSPPSSPPDPTAEPNSQPTEPSSDTGPTGKSGTTDEPGPAGKTGKTDEDGKTGKDGLGDDSGCQVGHTLDGDRVSFDPHAAIRAGKSPLFAILGEADQRARLALSIAQDAASRGTAVILVDLSGQLSARAGGLGRNVRVIRNQPSMPQLDDLIRGAGGLGGLWETVSQLSGGGLFQPRNRPGADLVEPGYVSVLNLSGDGALATAITAAQSLPGLLGPADFPRLLLLDLPSGLAVPAALSSRLGRIIRTAREQNAAVGLSAESAETVAHLAGSGALLSTVFAFATSSPVEADRLRDLLGSGAPILLNAPGTTHQPGDESWAVLRDLTGRLGQVRIGGA